MFINSIKKSDKLSVQFLSLYNQNTDQGDNGPTNGVVGGGAILITIRKSVGIHQDRKTKGIEI